MILNHPVQTLMVQNALGQGFLFHPLKFHTSYFLVFYLTGCPFLRLLTRLGEIILGYETFQLLQGTEHQKIPLTGHKKWTNTIYFQTPYISNVDEIAQTFNDFFIDSVKNLNINGNKAVLTDVGGLKDPVDIALKKFECHPSILDIK